MYLLIDSSAITHAVKYAMRMQPLSTFGDTIRTEVIFGFMKQLFAIKKKFPKYDLIFTWDSGKSFRKDLFPEYKLKRHSKEKTEEDKILDETTKIQTQILRTKVIPQLGFTNSFIQTGMEADDIIASTIASWPDEQYMVVSNDADLYQLLSFNVNMYKVKAKKVYTVGDFRKDYDLEHPEDWAEVKAWAGCSTDEIPGVEGVGEKKAIAFIKREMEKGKIFNRLNSEESKQIYERNLPLVKLPFKGTLPVDIEKDNLKAKDFKSVFKHYDFRSFLYADAFQDWKDLFNLE
jgi:DNA polymerase-1